MLRLRGNRIHLRDWQREDLPHFARWQQPGQEWQALDGPYYPPMSDAEIQKRVEGFGGMIERGAAWPEPRDALCIADAGTDAFLGRVTRYWVSRETNWLALGLDIYDPDRWGRGLGYEALGLWCDYVLREMPEIPRLDLRTWSGNVGMMRLAEKLGFALEARFRKARCFDGEQHDGIAYGMLREEWVARYPGGFEAAGLRVE